MGRILTIRGEPGSSMGSGLGVEYHGAGATFKTADGTSTFVIASEGGGNLVHWNTGGDSDIWLRVGTQLRPVPPNGWLYTLGSDGYLTYVRDAAFVPAPEPIPEPAPPPLSPSYVQYRDRLIAQLGSEYRYDANAQRGYLPDGTVSIGPETAYIDALLQANYSTLVPGPPPIPPPPPAPPLYQPPPSDEEDESQNEEPLAGEIPMWVWLVGGGLALYAFTRR